NDTREACRLTLAWQLTDFAGQVIRSGEIPVEAAAVSARVALTLDMKELAAGQDKRRLVLRAQLKDGKELISQRTLLFDKEKNLNLPRCAFTSKVEVRDGIAYITVQSGKFARHVFVESELTRGDFSDNFVDIFPDAPVTLTADANGADADAIRAGLRLTTVGNIENVYSKARCALKRLRIWAFPAHAGSWFIFKLRKKIP
ncbi:MAG: hypothetical protein FWF60_07830, partial [Oscillospiraceae bacterium]|nr:hypothetical protein [Oscillospiraceae bacterium]